MTDPAILYKKRTSVCSQLKIFADLINKFELSESATMDYLELRLEKAQELWNIFDAVQSDIELTVETDETAARVEFEEFFCKTISSARRLWKELNSKNQTPVDTYKYNTHNDNSIRLPIIDLPQFDGNYQNWLSFRDTFQSVIHDKSNISDIQKLQYLRSCLKDKAADIIKSLETSSESYIEAWELLNERYNNKRVIVHNHLKSLLEQPTVIKYSAQSLRSFLDNIKSHLRALKMLDQKVDACDSLFIYLMTAKLDKQTHHEWEKHIPGTEIPTIEQFLTFIQKRCQILEATNTNIHQNNNAKFNNNSRTQQAYSVTHNSSSCPICTDSHAVYMCEKLLNASVQERAKLIKTAHLCLNCLKKGHSVKDCRNSTCKVCKKKHNTLLHNTTTHKLDYKEKETTPIVSAHISTSTEILLSTAQIQILDKNNKPIMCRVLLDPGSQSNFISENLAKKLQLQRQDINIPVVAINNLKTYLKQSINAIIKSTHTNFSQSLSFLILPKITNTLPSTQINRKNISIPKNISLADPAFHQPAEIDALIGAELFYTLLCPGQIKLNNHGAVIQKTVLGWIVSGKIFEGNKNLQARSCHFTSTLEQQIEKFWTLEEIPYTKQLSVEDQACEEHFIKHSIRDAAGKIIVRLPFKNNKTLLGNSYGLALKHFYALEKKLNRDDTLKIQYTDFLKEYLELNHMTEIKNADKNEGYYLPHHAVIKQDSITTKLRVVFDGSAKTSTGISLNDTLMIGPTLQVDLFSLLMKCRFQNILITADIEKMYRQILLHKDDRKFQKILWRDDPNSAIKTFQLNTVTYGTTSAPFLAIRALQKLAQDEKNSYPLAANAIINDIYVDNFLTGAKNLKEAIELRDQLIKITKLGGLNLRQWSSNTHEVINIFEEDKIQDNAILLDTTAAIKTLGIYWSPIQDELTYKINEIKHKDKVTKRTILSQIASLFDPLGLLGPVIVKAKILMQKIWQLKVDWDESVPLHIHTNWITYKDQLKILNEFKVPRKIFNDNYTHLQLHGFCDASEKAYGACIYIVSYSKTNPYTALLCSKTRVAPLQSKSLPRLELCAALLLAKLIDSTIKNLKINYQKIIAWSDSTITLHWINTPSNNLKTFVANRVAKIQENKQIHAWRHVPTQDNPADFISRGQSPTEFINNKLWQNGPSWLQNENQWPINKLKEIKIPEQRTSIALVAVKNIQKINFDRFSSIEKIKRILVYCIRFIELKTIKKEPSKFMTTQELNTAHNIIIKLTQLEFKIEIITLKQNKAIHISSDLYRLNPFIDPQGILRVGGRLLNSNLAYSQKFPIVLPKKHHITTLIIRKTHVENLHAGIQNTLAAVRQKYWPIDGKNTTKKIIHACMRCYRARPTEANYLMGNLPKDRLQVTRPFSNVGIDYCGPFFVKEKKNRNRNKVKVYAAIFVCLSIKAVHIEIVSDLTTEAFLNAFYRFCARRGKPHTVYSDNGTNFVGAQHEIKEIENFIKSNKHNTEVQNKLTNDSIEWHFNPPRAPHFGGIWEAAVKSFKHHFVRTVGSELFTYEQLNTYAIEIEAVLNSRPLTPLSNDPNDLQTLTPSHFLIGDLLKCVPQHDLSNIAVNKLSTWQHIQRVKQHFWSRWQKEYLNQLNVRSKWQKNTDQLQAGTMVIIKEENLPPLQWKIGRISQLHPGTDGITRVVTVKTALGEYKRGVTRLCILPTDI